MKLTKVSTDKKYGYEPNSKTAIKVGKVENGTAFLKSLLGPNGETVQFQRIGSCCEFKSSASIWGTGYLDKYEVYYQGLQQPIVLYINGYEYSTPQCPYGFTFKTADKIEEPYIFSKDSILKVPFCDWANVYKADNTTLLKDRVRELPFADTKPVFEGGLVKLREYFAANPLTDERAQEIVFGVSICFLVNCEGKAGRFEIISKGKGELETLANLVLEKVNNMPQTWLPAKKNREPVDCYQVLYFTVEGGDLRNVSYR
ncbi:hypothetical protein LJB85_03970 [Porphyromonadaceae bacterium OttesenSCG-928-L07]|nr:hypothetical protein [Porphyromonadaceae bacterium OttesenSCG-928-L07]MDL2282959.1 hypothetical protein [Odoribacter sp. OttesenSCG-928-G04]